jgi:UDP-N-acetylmuramoylalanine--D-glutamate ligase
LKKNLVILGAGESGTGAAILGVVQGWNVFVSDYGTIDQDSKNELDARGILNSAAGTHRLKSLE